MRYFITSNLELITMYNVVHHYKTLKGAGLLREYENFQQYLNACLSSNGGELTSISKEDAREISVETFHEVPAKYGTALTKTGQYHEPLYFLKRTVTNAKEVRWEGVNYVMIDEEDNHIFQASGYSKDRGLFCDLY